MVESETLNMQSETLNMQSVTLSTSPKKSKKKKSYFFTSMNFKNARGEGAQKVWDQFTDPDTELYESILEKYNGATEEEQNAAKNDLNECADGFGNAFYDGRPAAMLAWADLSEGDRDKVAKFIDPDMEE